MDRRLKVCRIDGCRQRFRSFSARYGHEHGSYHTKIGKYECPCGKKFFQYGSLMRHKRYYHGGLKYECNECK